jgi:hypothetical protein
MDENPKSLEEMNAGERCNLLARVTDALQDAADEAEHRGDTRFAANSKCVAGMIKAYPSHIDRSDLRSVELLLEHGLTLLHLYLTRTKKQSSIH